MSLHETKPILIPIQNVAEMNKDQDYLVYLNGNPVVMTNRAEGQAVLEYNPYPGFYALSHLDGGVAYAIINPPAEQTVQTTTELHDVLNQITFEKTALDWQWKIEVEPVRMGRKPPISEDKPDEIVSLEEGWFVSLRFLRPDTQTGDCGWGQSRREIIFEGATVTSIVKTIWVLFTMTVTHEMMEGFRYQRKRPFDPHNSITALNSLQTGRKD